jgi:6,7-dimethyl-8-ribityllumazine synthase
VINDIAGDTTGKAMHIGVAVTVWNQAITDRMKTAAVNRLESHGVNEITVLTVPGALELPLGALALADRGCDGVVAIGVVIKGETDHYDIVVRESTSGIARVALERGVPVANAILAVHDVSLAVARAGPDDSNKGVEAADAVVVMVNALRKLARG